MKVLLDTDILSMFAKVGELEILQELFGDSLAMVPGVEEEVSVPLDYGYQFPNQILGTIPTISLDDKANQGLRRLTEEEERLGRGERESIAVGKTRGYAFATNDFVAREVASDSGVTVFSLQAILRALWKEEMRTKEEVRHLLDNIQETDNLEVTYQVEQEIFAE